MAEKYTFMSFQSNTFSISILFIQLTTKIKHEDRPSDA